MIIYWTYCQLFTLTQTTFGHSASWKQNIVLLNELPLIKHFVPSQVTWSKDFWWRTLQNSETPTFTLFSSNWMLSPSSLQTWCTLSWASTHHSYASTASCASLVCLSSLIGQRQEPTTQTSSASGTWFSTFWLLSTGMPASTMPSRSL